MNKKIKEFYNRIITAFYESEYHIDATGFRGVGRNELFEIIKIIRGNCKNIKNDLASLYKYHPETIEMCKSQQERNCPDYNQYCNCCDPSIPECDYPCNIKRQKYYESQNFRNTPEYRKWRKYVYERDKYCCQDCNVVGGELNAHHIKKYKDHPDERLSVDNGITLCIECHRKRHRNGVKNGR
ncbi:HNH endonuclease [Candidatus Pacearchaeota archaeon]|nr:HNH endonuclease [Candidatus Pacearchaeota archaeon]